MKSVILFSILVIGFSMVISAESAPNQLVINEIDINPIGDDSKSVVEWVELYNPSSSKIDIGGWTISSTTGQKKTLTIPLGSMIEPGKFLTYYYQRSWFVDSGESVELRDKNGTLIDKTPLLSDMGNDPTSWQRIYDGYDSDTATDWKFTTSTAGSSNGKLLSTGSTSSVSISVVSDKLSYSFGETAIIQGTVSKQLFVMSPYFQADQIQVKILGPNFDKTISLYPDLNLNYKTTINLTTVLGINEGLYNVSVKYGDATSQTSFSVGNKIIIKDVKEENVIGISTDKSQYLPGDTVYLTGFTAEVIPLEAMKFTVNDPNGKLISSGTLYPTNGKFSTSVFLNTINPIYGTFQVHGKYFDKSVITSFEVIQDRKEAKVISLQTDKDLYGLGEVVKITGRVNTVWVSSLDLEITQTKNLSLGTVTSGGGSGFKILDVVRPAGDGTFSYSFEIPASNSRLGDYKISVSKEIGIASKIIQAVENPSQTINDTGPLSLLTDKVIYDLGDTMTISGLVANPTIRSSFETPPVKISMSREDGKPLEIVALPPGAKSRQNNGLIIAYEFTAIPESSGRFSVQTKITQTVFTEGTYLIKAEYNGVTKTNIVGISNPLKSGVGFFITLDKSVYGLGEMVNLTGLLPPTADTSVMISITTPDGTRSDSGALVNNQRFSWSWITPISEKPSVIKLDDRSITKTNYGIYKIHVSIPSKSEDVFFKVSADPKNDSLSLTPLYVSSEKSIYKAGEKLKVIGTVINTAQGSEGLIIPERVTILILDDKFPYKQIYQSSVYPDQGGNFQSSFELPITIFSEGQYKIKAQYLNKKSESTFGVANEFSFNSGEKTSLLLSTDKAEYYPGDIVVLSGKPNKPIYLEKFDVSVNKKTESNINCGSFYCGVHLGPVTTIRPSSLGSFSYQIQIPDSSSSLGVYEVKVDAGFEIKTLNFDVKLKPIITKSTTSTKTIIDKVIRIPDDQISISTQEKIIETQLVMPRVVSGSLVTTKDDQSNVNLRITSESGICVIGPDEICLVHDSTRRPGTTSVYQAVNVDGVNLNIRYSGPDARLEKFDILPVTSDEFLPNTVWNVDVVKQDQISRFYYKITYKTLE